MSRSVPPLPASDFYRAFTGRVRETLAEVEAEHARPADEATTRRSVDAYLAREYPALFPAGQPSAAPSGHFPWCDSHRTDVCDDGTRLTDHDGARVHLPVPPGMHPRAGEVLTAALYYSENSIDKQVLLSLGSGGEGTLLDAAEADTVIKSLAAFLENLRLLRGQMAAGR